MAEFAVLGSKGSELQLAAFSEVLSTLCNSNGSTLSLGATFRLWGCQDCSEFGGMLAHVNYSVENSFVRLIPTRCTGHNWSCVNNGVRMLVCVSKIATVYLKNSKIPIVYLGWRWNEMDLWIRLRMYTLLRRTVPFYPSSTCSHDKTRERPSDSQTQKVWVDPR